MVLDSWTTKRTYFEIRQISETHRRIDVCTKSGRVYALTIAADTVDPATTRDCCEYNWQVHRREFLPFNQSEGRYVGL